MRRDKYLPSSGLIPCSLCMKYYILIIMEGLLAKKKKGEPVPKYYLHYYYHGEQRNPDAESIPESRMISPQWKCPAHRESSLACGFVLFVV